MTGAAAFVLFLYLHDRIWPGTVEKNILIAVKGQNALYKRVNQSFPQFAVIFSEANLEKIVLKTWCERECQK